MTPDQIYHRLCDRDLLKGKRGTRSASVAPAAAPISSSGEIRGRAADGTPMVAKIGVGGKSLAARIAEEEAAKAKASTKPKRGHRGN